jgi:hypothetical protein
MKAGTFQLIGAVVLVCTLSMPAFAGKSTDSNIIVLDAPGADTTPNDYNGTLPTGINAEGVVVGYYFSAANVCHGFLRYPDGKYLSFDAPGADTTPNDNSGTFPTAISALGEVTGYFIDVSGAAHGFLRSAAGKFTSFDVPVAAGTSIPVAINLEGSVVGYYADLNSQFHAFIRRPDGTFVSFDGPNGCASGTSAGCYGTAAFNINLFGVVAANYEDDSGNFVTVGLIRSPSGKLTTYEVPGIGTGPYQGTGCRGCAVGLNDAGAIAGIYTDSNNVYHGFVRSPNGNFTTFDAPGAGTSSYQGTGCGADCAVSISALGEVTGTYSDSNYNYHGYFRSSNGTVQSFDPPNSIETVPDSIGALGVATGYYLDTNNVYHGFLRIPALR